MRHLPAALLALVLAVLGLAGCGLGAGEEESRDEGANLLITRDFGRQGLGRVQFDPIPASATVMRLLQEDYEVQTRYGGGFVQSIDGITGGRDRGRPVDWFYYVNGIEASTGAAERRVAAGDRIWWDRHDWGKAMRIPAVVGSFPEPFLSGTEGKRLPIRIECAPGARRECGEVAERLEIAGVKETATSTIGQIQERELLRVLVGPWSEVRKDPATLRLERGPEASGVFARPVDGGRGLELLSPSGRVVETVGGGTGLIAATSLEDAPPVWVVTGTDAVGVSAAAAALQEDLLRNRFGAVIQQGKASSLPRFEAGT